MVLRRYYVDNLKLTSQGQAERLLAEMGLLNMDEFDKYAESKMPLLKNLMQMSDLNIRKAYQQSFRQLPRVASFIGTSNRFDLLTDPTGSRRFLCVEVERVIDCTHIEHDQIYAQLKAELLAGRRDWFTKEEGRCCRCRMRRSTVFVPQRMFFIVIFVWRISVRSVSVLRLPRFSGNFSKRIPLPCAASILCASAKCC